MTLRVFAPTDLELREGLEFEVDSDESHYLQRVRRVAAGAQVEVFAHDARARCELVHVGGARGLARLRMHAWVVEPDAGPARTLVLGLPERAAALESYRNAFALGASELLFVRCARSQGGAPSEKRLAKVARATMRQCGRPTRPAHTFVTSLEAALEISSERPLLFAHPVDAESSASAPLHSGPLRLAIGPEGGFDEAESALLAARGQPLSLGAWILRTELAVAAGLARLQKPSPFSRAAPGTGPA